MQTPRPGEEDYWLWRPTRSAASVSSLVSHNAAARRSRPRESRPRGRSCPRGRQDVRTPSGGECQDGAREAHLHRVDVDERIDVTIKDDDVRRDIASGELGWAVPRAGALVVGPKGGCV